MLFDGQACCVSDPVRHMSVSHRLVGSSAQRMVFLGGVNVEFEKFEMSRNFLKVARMLDFWQNPIMYLKTEPSLIFQTNKTRGFVLIGSQQERKTFSTLPRGKFNLLYTASEGRCWGLL